MANQPQDDRTIPASVRRAAVVVAGGDPAGPGPTPSTRPPWLLQQHYSGQIDLGRELNQRFSSVPLLSVIRRRGSPGESAHMKVILASQDGLAAVTWEASAGQPGVQVAFTFASMLSLRFSLDDVTAAGGMRWLQLVRGAQKGTVFLWGASRWEYDYLICAIERQFINLFAFSPRGYEAAARLTPNVRAELFGWLEAVWRSAAPPDEPPQLLSW